MDKQQLYTYLESIKGVPFTVFGDDEKYVITKLDGYGYHLDDSRGNLVAVVYEMDCTADMLVFGAKWLGTYMKRKVAIDAIQFVDAKQEAA